MVINWLNCPCCQTVVACSCFPSCLRQIVEALVIDFPVFYFRSLLRCHRSALSITRWRWACLMPSWWSTRSSRYQVSLKRRHLYLTSAHLCKERIIKKCKLEPRKPWMIESICGHSFTVFWGPCPFLKIYSNSSPGQDWNIHCVGAKMLG